MLLEIICIYKIMFIEHYFVSIFFFFMYLYRSRGSEPQPGTGHSCDHRAFVTVDTCCSHCSPEKEQLSTRTIRNNCYQRLFHYANANQSSFVSCLPSNTTFTQQILVWSILSLLLWLRILEVPSVKAKCRLVHWLTVIIDPLYDIFIILRLLY